MIQLIIPERHNEFARELRAMHQLRYRVFRERLDWNVQTSGDLELDQFDTLNPHYLLLRQTDGRVAGCVRLLPTTGPTMLRDVFPELLDGRSVPEDLGVWESSRFALDLAPPTSNGSAGVALETFWLLAAMIEFGLSRRLTRIVTVTDLRMERILRRAGWTLDRIGAPRQIGSTQAVAGFLDVSLENLMTVREKGELGCSVLWEPVSLKVA